MLRILLLLMPWTSIATVMWGTTKAHQDKTHGQEKGASSLLLNPYIHYCRSPNMETFTCWWRLPDNSSLNNENVTYMFTYSVGKGPKKECPDYVTGGPNSCYFDSQHTQVWEIYCMNVMAYSRHGNRTSEDHCLDVVDIVETDPPFNLTYWLTNSSVEESGRTAVVSWLYPIAADVHMGWVTLVYELQYRRMSEPHNWKVKGVLREPRLELLDLPVGSYVVRVRCKSHNNGLWSKWSDPLIIDIPPNQTIDKMLAMILVSGIGVVAFLMIGFGVIPHGKRIKAFLLPRVPKPRIRGIDPTLLKNGKMDEINRLFNSFHGYSPPQYSVESWQQVSADEGQSLKGSPLAQAAEKSGMCSPSTQRPSCLEDQQTEDGPTPYCVTPSHNTEAPPSAPPVETQAWAWLTSNHGYTELLNIPNLGYTAVVNPAQAVAPPACQDFYTCVNGVTTSGAVHLVPCLSPHLRNTAYLQLGDPANSKRKDMAEKSSRLAMCKAKQAAPAVSGALVSPTGMTGATAGEVGDSYTTLDDLSLREWCADVAPAQGDLCTGLASVYGKEGFLCSEQN
ncbi:growth hormone receptor-like [Megalops cyprinoides]|uniref:growth hormone receptor-like n=1 Tax=Megalops cyprinoides TaxID=118141 RepID=UPI001865452A|nr:growth hormone receptor-like [Megalops cyprinoides]